MAYIDFIYITFLKCQNNRNKNSSKGKRWDGDSEEVVTKWAT